MTRRRTLLPLSACFALCVASIWFSHQAGIHERRAIAWYQKANRQIDEIRRMDAETKRALAEAERHLAATKAACNGTGKSS
jgi:hypothetical protein